LCGRIAGASGKAAAGSAPKVPDSVSAHPRVKFARLCKADKCGCAQCRRALSDLDAPGAA